MNQHAEEKFREEHERDAIASMRRPEELGSIPGAEFVKGPMLSFCCDAPVTGGLWKTKGIRTGTCSKCHNDATFREVIK